MFRLSQIAVPVLGLAAWVGVAGCAKNERHAEIPPSASEVSAGSREVVATAASSGDVYIYDATSGKMVYTGKVNRGQIVKVEAEQNRVSLDGRTLTERDLPNEHQYKIFFDSAMVEQAQPAAQQQPPAVQQQPARTYQPQPAAPAPQTPPAQRPPY